jgi:DNA helicase-2/ATP-dependent DNA helicase PcrA
MADFTILLEFQQDFGDGLPDEDTSTMVKLEENYRSSENILEAANYLIENNTERIDKVLKPTRGAGEQIYCHKADDEIAEAEFVINQVRRLERQYPEMSWGSLPSFIALMPSLARLKNLWYAGAFPTPWLEV